MSETPRPRLGDYRNDGTEVWNGRDWRPVQDAPKQPWSLPRVRSQSYYAPSSSRDDEEGPEFVRTYGEHEITVSAGTAFKIGFYAFWGFLVAGLVPWIVIFLLFVVLARR